jgi:6-phosphofructo-2-kinase/fructose-2,6-biphosphatase 2
MAYGCHEERYHLPIAAVDTHRPKPNKHSKTGSGQLDTNAAEEILNRSGVKRDYFGDTAHHSDKPTVPETPGTQVKQALEKAVDAGDVAPKVAQVP